MLNAHLLPCRRHQDAAGGAYITPLVVERNCDQCQAPTSFLVSTRWHSILLTIPIVVLGEMGWESKRKLRLYRHTSVV